jgi:hypothetical protein
MTYQNLIANPSPQVLKKMELHKSHFCSWFSNVEVYCMSLFSVIKASFTQMFVKAYNI